MEYARLIRAAMQQPWAITPAMAATITDLLHFRAAGGRFTADEIRARIGAAADDDRPTARRQGLVAVIPVWGVIAPRTFEASSGMTSTETIRAWVKRAVADEEVSAILLDISSPGGTADGVAYLNKSTGGNFAKASAKQQYELVLSMEGTAFFATVRGQCVTSLYDNDMAYAVFGYPGSAWEKGGYITRGFQDLKWLPAPSKAASPPPYMG